MKRLQRGFTLVEMLVVMGIVGVLIAMLTGAFKYVQNTAWQARSQELVSNVATALSIYIQREGTWPTEILDSKGVVNNEVCKVLQQSRLLDVSTVTTNSIGTVVSNPNSPERFGLFSPWGQRMIRGIPKTTASLGALPSADLLKHILQFRVDINLDGKIDSSDSQLGAIPGVGSVIRASAIVWSCGPNGKDDGDTGAKKSSENRQSWVGGGQ
jgi:prepilin-type N-terminal cleavage/methylation domain-containing protein